MTNLFDGGQPIVHHVAHKEPVACEFWIMCQEHGQENCPDAGIARCVCHDMTWCLMHLITHVAMRYDHA